MQEAVIMNGNGIEGHLKAVSALQSKNNPRIRHDAFQLSDEEKIRRITDQFAEILYTLGFNPDDESIRHTPQRVATMYVKELFKGMNPANRPQMALFPNDSQYSRMIIEKNITVFSCCEHHLVPITGKAHLAYFPSGKIVGLSKLNRIVEYLSSQPQVQERLTMQIAQEMKTILNTNDVAVVIDAVHLCVNSRGIKDINSSTVTMEFGGKFNDDSLKEQFLNSINK